MLGLSSLCSGPCSDGDAASCTHMWQPGAWWLARRELTLMLFSLLLLLLLWLLLLLLLFLLLLCCYCCCCRNIFPIWALGLYRRLVLLGHSRTSAAAAADGSKAAAAEGAVLAPGTAWLCAVSDFVSTAGSGSVAVNGSAANGSTH